MKRTHVNFWIDALAFGALALLASTGAVLHYQLPAGSGGGGGGGLGPRALDRQVEVLWGWTRHDWGAIHFAIAWALMALLAVHLALHWKWIVCVVKGQPTQASGRKLALGVLGLTAVIVLTSVPLVSSTRTTTRRELLSNAPPAAEAAPGSDWAESPDGATDPTTAWLRGSLTFAEVAEASGRPTSWFVDQLDLPASTAPTDRVGPVLRANDRRLSDLRRLLAAEPPRP